MTDNYSLLREQLLSFNIEKWVPQRYAAYRPLLVDGMSFFLGQLPSSRQWEILSSQLAMPRETHAADRLVDLLHHCPTLHKLGQVVARDQRLALELRLSLQRLESLRPSIPKDQWLAAIHRELGNPSEIGIAIADQALAEASVAVIVPFTWQTGRSQESAEGVFKILKPGVIDRLREDLDAWSKLANFIEQRSADYGLPNLNYRETFDNIRELLTNEVRLDLEQAHLEQAGAFYAPWSNIIIPQLLPFCTPQLTAMERIDGCKITDAQLPGTQARRMAELLLDALLAKPFWSQAPTAIIHADPHAGNLFVTQDQQLAILDWSLVSPLHKDQRIQVVQIILGALTLNADQICQAISALSKQPGDESLLRSTVAESLWEVRQGTFPGFPWLMNLLDQVATSTGIEFAEEFLWFRKALLTLSGVIADLAGDTSTTQVLLRSGLGQFLRELAERMVTAPYSRDFATHVSNADLAELWALLPLTFTRLWMENWQDYWQRTYWPWPWPDKADSPNW